MAAKRTDPMEFHLDWVSQTPAQDMERIASDYGFDIRILELHGPGGGNPLVAIGLGDPRESEGYLPSGLPDEHQAMRLVGLLLSHGYTSEDLILCAANDETRDDVMRVLNWLLKEARDAKEKS